MKRIRKILFTGLIALVMILGSAGMVWATVTISATTVSSSGALTLTGATASTWSTTVGDVTIQSGNGAINLTAVSDVVIPSGVGITFAGTEKIESNGTDLTITVGASGDINIGTDIGLTFADDGEKIESDGTDLTIASGGGIQLDATIGVTLGGTVGAAGSGDAGAQVYTAVLMCGSVITHDPGVGSANGTTDTAANLISDCVGTNGDSHTVLLRNTASTTEAITIVAGANVILLEPNDGSAHDVVIEQNGWARIRFTNLDGTNVVVEVTELSDADS